MNSSPSFSSSSSPAISRAWVQEVTSREGCFSMRARICSHCLPKGPPPATWACEVIASVIRWISVPNHTGLLNGINGFSPRRAHISCGDRSSSQRGPRVQVPSFPVLTRVASTPSQEED